MLAWFHLTTSRRRGYPQVTGNMCMSVSHLDQTESDRDLKFDTHTRLEHIVKFFLGMLRTLVILLLVAFLRLTWKGLRPLITKLKRGYRENYENYSRWCFLAFLNHFLPILCMKRGNRTLENSKFKNRLKNTFFRVGTKLNFRFYPYKNCVRYVTYTNKYIHTNIRTYKQIQGKHGW